MSKWFKAFGFGDESEPQLGSLDANQLRRAMRIRETMRWRGFNLEPYTDEELIRAADRIGEVSADGETSEASREALADALRKGWGSHDWPGAAVVESGEATTIQHPPDPQEDAPEPQPVAASPFASDAPAADAPVVESADEETEAEPEREPVAAAVAAPAAEAERTPLVRVRHIFGAHSWRPREDNRGPYLYCPGCRQDRRGAAAARAARSRRPQPTGPIPFPTADPTATGRRAPDADGAAESAARPSGGTATGFVRWYFATPWWVKLVSAFVVLQLIGVVVSLLGSA
jgi:hypothetical protein